MEKPIEIPISQGKIILLLLGVAMFVLLGFWLSIDPYLFADGWEAQFVRAVGIISILFFGACGLFGFKRLFVNPIGLIIDEKGITDRTNATSIGLVKWEDIITIKTLQVYTNWFLVIYVQNPQDYINKAPNRFIKGTMKANHKLYGSPISIVSTTLAIDFNSLESTVMVAFEKYKTPFK